MKHSHADIPRIHQNKYFLIFNSVFNEHVSITKFEVHTLYYAGQS